METSENPVLNKILDLNEERMVEIMQHLNFKDLFCLHKTERRFHNAIN